MSAKTTKPKRPAESFADRAVRFINKLTHTGDYNGEPFALREWQEKIVRKILGTLRPDGTRQYRRAFLALPRKQGKTELIAAIANCLLLATGRRGQHIYSASGDHKQAALIFRAAASMIRNDPTLSQHCVIYESYKRIEVPGLDSFYEALSSEAKLKHGLSPAAVLFDEVHILPDRELHDVLTTGFGARREPLTLYITTAGHDRASLCWELWQHARNVRDGIVDDPTFLPILYEVSPDDDWTDEAVWHKAMPALDDFCSLEFIRDEFRKAQMMPSFENTFKRLYLNLWTEQATRWLQVERWLACAGLSEAELIDRPCMAGLDLGVTGDMSAAAFLFENDLGGVDVAVRYWVPRDGRWKDEVENRERYRLWERQGFLKFTDGEVKDDDVIEADIVALNQRWPIQQMTADRAYAMSLLTRLFNKHEIPIKGVPQGPITLNAAMVDLEEMILAGTLRHTNNPVLNWNVANANVSRNSTGLMYLDKAMDRIRIDGLAAVIDARVPAASGEESPAIGDSVYNERSLLTV